MLKNPADQGAGQSVATVGLTRIAKYQAIRRRAAADDPGPDSLVAGSIARRPSQGRESTGHWRSASGHRAALRAQTFSLVLRDSDILIVNHAGRWLGYRAATALAVSTTAIAFPDGGSQPRRIRRGTRPLVRLPARVARGFGRADKIPATTLRSAEAWRYVKSKTLYSAH
jgi:hypothetical protein